MCRADEAETQAFEKLLPAVLTHSKHLHTYCDDIRSLKLVQDALQHNHSIIACSINENDMFASILLFNRVRLRRREGGKEWDDDFI